MNCICVFMAVNNAGLGNWLLAGWPPPQILGYLALEPGFSGEIEVPAGGGEGGRRTLRQEEADQTPNSSEESHHEGSVQGRPANVTRESVPTSDTSGIWR